MNKEINKNYGKALVYLLIYLTFSSAIIYFNFNRRYLIFNAGLSFIPYILSVFTLNHKNNAIIIFFCLIFIVVFYPNSVYMFTDFIHIKTKEYYTFSNGKVSYIMDYVNWVKLACDTSLIVLSLVLSFETYVNILKILRCYGYKIASFVILMFTCFASGFAVYIGRFLRFNSWNIFQIKSIVLDIIANKTDNDYRLIALFAIFQFTIIILFANLKRN